MEPRLNFFIWILAKLPIVGNRGPLFVTLLLTLTICPNSGAIINGVPSLEPAAVAIVLSFENGKYITCSGSLITPMHVLTAAHCVTQSVLNQLSERPRRVRARPSNFKIYFGPGIAAATYITDSGLSEVEDQSSQLQNGILIDVQDVVQHPLYARAMNDIAVLKLSKPVTSVQRLFLPENNFEIQGTVLRAVGFGNQSLNPSAKTFPYGLKLEYAAIFEENLEEGLFNVIGRGLERTASSDSGSPLIKENSGKKFVVGVLQSPRWKTNDDSAENTGGRYTSVWAHLAWLKSVIEK